MHDRPQRKLQDIFQSLDDAVASIPDRPSPPKRQNTIKSLYSTLSKYGVKIKSSDGAFDASTASSIGLSKTPRLAAILSRAGTKTRKALPLTRRLSARSTSDYRPSSTSSFLMRLETFKLNTYSNKPSEIDAVAASKCGWINEGKDRLLCGICGVSWVVVSREKMSRDAANTLVKKQQAQLVDNHKGGCPWRTRQCDADVYRIQLSSTTAMAKDIKSRALQLEPLLENVEVKHPLLSNQVQSLLKTVASVHLDEFSFSFEAPNSPASSGKEPCPVSPEPDASAVLAALFGWSVSPPMPDPPPMPFRVGTPLSRSVSAAPSVSSTPRRTSNLGPSTSSPILARTPRATPAPEHRPAMLYCSLCHRRLGLWAFGTAQVNSPAASQPRQVDVLKEHRPYCPYVTRSTTVPAFPVPQILSSPNASTASLASISPTATATANGPIEGWRAVLSVILRHRMSQRHWESLLSGAVKRAGGQLESAGENQCGDVPIETDPVEAMVADVKRKGGRELLSYVKSLLG
ncbi:C3HC zinc finger-like-domain-containing protein [Vararia minispora EC-137]|uniref:C3HC zinc finger-like-domain-containing protein n=1 Tax=Vararia minispora EC-137 TaxID=1314806 RepID=A0ACB8QCL9_9AGAM|nr:C3HC zinc finger-like-domain-containing protein [Vararia minispora EC-137]